MRKFVLIPIVNLGTEATGLFIEIMSEPACLTGVNFQQLKNSGLAREVKKTEAILKRLSHSRTSSNHLYLSHQFINMSNLPISFGLTLASFLQHKKCFYRKIITIGDIDMSSSQLLISAGHYFETQLTAILELGRQPFKIALFVPAQQLNESHHYLAHDLAELNIELNAVDTLYEALSYLGVA